MPDIQIHESSRAFIPTLEEAISRTVEYHAGIRDTALSVCVLVETAHHPALKEKDSTYAASMVAWTVHRMITTGQLIAIDCETTESSYTYLLPPNASVMITEPVRIEPETQTRH